MRHLNAACGSALLASLVTLGLPAAARAEDPTPRRVAESLQDTGFVRIDQTPFYNSTEHARDLARRSGKWVLLLRMLGELEGKT